jgi:hypothetical protein
MQPFKKQSVLKLSAGSCSGLFLAQLFAQDPKLLLLDEPTNHWTWCTRNRSSHSSATGSPNRPLRPIRGARSLPGQGLRHPCAAAA